MSSGQNPSERPDLLGTRGDPAPSPAIRCHRDGIESFVTPQELSTIVQSAAEPLWIDIDSTDRAQHAVLEKVFRFHPLAIEDTLDPRTRVKVEEYNGYLFIVLRWMRFDPDKPLPSERPESKKLCLFLGHSYLVSVHAGALPSIADAAAKLQNNAGALLREGGSSRVAHLICDSVVDDYFLILAEVDDFVEQLEHLDPVDCDRKTLARILQVRRLAFAVHRSLVPQREIFDALAHRPYSFVSPGAQLYFRDVYDHASRITDSLDAYRDLIAETTDSYMAQTSMRLENASKLFAAVATIAIPFVLVSSIYGMNFKDIPLAANPAGFWIVFGGQTLVSLGILAFLRLRGLV